MVYIFLSIFSILYITLLVINYFSKERINSFENKFVVFMLIVTIVGLILDLSCFAVFLLFKNQDSFTGMFFLKSFVVYIATYMWLLNIYIFYLTCKKRLKSKFNSRKYILSFIKYSLPVYLFLIAVIYYVPLYYYAKYPRYYTYGIAAKILVVLDISFIAIWIVRCVSFTLSDKKNQYSSHIFVVIIGIVLCACAAVIPQIVDPSIQILSATQAFILCLIYLSIDNPDALLINELKIAREQADKASKAKTDFLSSMSHEIRTPLNAIVGFSDCIVDANSLDEAKSNAKDMIYASQTLLEVVNGILDISKIEAGKLELTFSSYNSDDLFNELAKLISPRMKDKGLDFSYSISSDVPKKLYGDVPNIKKIVTNLLSNACKYTDKGYVRYEVNCINKDTYTSLIISVEDSGRGISKNNRVKMFNKFQRFDKYKNSNIEGTGLGLSITKQLVELMGGKIIVHSVYGVGSKFIVVLNQKINSSECHDSNLVDSENIDLNDKEILIVDDNKLNIKVASQLLSRYNANKISSCLSGSECLDIIKNGKKFDIILLDDMMPNMSGLETLKRLRKIKNFDIPVIALTANAISGMREKYLDDGFDGYLAKPIDKVELVRTLNTFLFHKTKAIENNIVEYDINPEEYIIPISDNIEKDIKNMIDFTYNANTFNSTETVKTIPVVDLDMNLIKKVNEFGVDYLKKSGVNLKYALDLLGDMEMYNITAKDFLEEVEKKWKKINNYKDSNDMPNYAIEVHSLKSDSKYLGLLKLADIAYQHEQKSKENDSKYVNDHFNDLKKQYEKAIKIIKNYTSNL